MSRRVGECQVCICGQTNDSAPSIPTIAETSPAANVLHVGVEHVAELGDVIVVTAADKSLELLQSIPPYPRISIAHDAFDAPILSSTIVNERYLISSSMSGSIHLHNLKTRTTLDSRRDHAKYVVRLASFSSNDTTWIASAGWDAKVLVYKMKLDDQTPSLGSPIAEVKLLSNPEAILFVKHPELELPCLIVSRRDSTFLYYYSLPTSTSDTPSELQLIGKQNLAPHSNAWIAFTPAALALSPRDPSLLAVATSAIPHMKLIIVRLMLPAINTLTTQPPMDSSQQAPAAQARAQLALQEREAAAILIHVTTLSPQTQYSTPALAWRPDGSGVWVNGDDGVVRGLEATTGKIVATLKDGHEPGVKIRCLCTGTVEGGKEVVVSGGFDKRLVIWTIEEK